MATHERLNIYLDGPEVRAAVRKAAIRHRMSLSAYCLSAIRDRLSDEGLLPKPRMTPREAARRLDELRNSLEPLGFPVSELVAEGRKQF